MCPAVNSVQQREEGRRTNEVWQRGTEKEGYLSLDKLLTFEASEHKMEKLGVKILLRSRKSSAGDPAELGFFCHFSPSRCPMAIN
jgi:hypothetical protein